jgi:hypothetical protein
MSSERVSRYNARKALERSLRSRGLARAVAKELYIRCRQDHKAFMLEMRELVKLLHVTAPRKKSVGGVLGLRDTLKRERLAHSRSRSQVFVVTDSKAEQHRQAAAMEQGRTGKGGFVAHS